MSTSLAPDSQEASKVDPFTQRMINSTLEFRTVKDFFEWNWTDRQIWRSLALICRLGKVCLGSLSRASVVPY